jgi:hypothetical protein
MNHPEPCRYDNLETGISDPCIASIDGYTALETTNDFISELTGQDFDADQLQYFHCESTAAGDPTQLEPHLEDLPPAAPAPTPCNPDPLDQFTNAAITLEQLSPVCSTCNHTPKCTCRLRKRVSDLRSQNESIWAEREKMRCSLDGLRQMLESQDEFLQIMEDKGMVSAEAMGRLWEHQDRMRAVVMGHR